VHAEPVDAEPVDAELVDAELVDVLVDGISDLEGSAEVSETEAEGTDGKGSNKEIDEGRDWENARDVSWRIRCGTSFRSSFRRWNDCKTRSHKNEVRSSNSWSTPSISFC